MNNKKRLVYVSFELLVTKYELVLLNEWRIVGQSERTSAKVGTKVAFAQN